MLGRKYVVKPGDSLWDIAQRELGEPLRWPELFAHNNRPEVARASGTSIRDPDLIFVGQTLFLPDVAPAPGRGGGPMPGRPGPVPPSAQRRPPRPLGPSSGGTGRRIARRHVQSPTFEYDLGGLPAITVVSPLHVAEVKLSGSLSIRSGKLLDFATVSQKSVEIAAKRESESILGKLVNQTKVGWNPATRNLSFENGITLHSTSGYVPSFGVKISVSSAGLPAIQASSECPSVQGRVGDHVYLARDFGIDISLTPRAPDAQLRPAPVPVAPPVAAPVPNAQRLPAPTTGPSTWDYLVCGTLVAGAGLLVAATLVEDVATFGAGVADDAPSFAAAAGRVALGMKAIETVPPAGSVYVEGAGGI